MKTSELQGAALDWAVAMCERLKGNVLGAILAGELSPSTQWHYGGPIIERKGIDVRRYEWLSPSMKVLWWSAQFYGTLNPCEQYGPTPLVAAMRCYVASKLGDEIEVPRKLLGVEE